MIFEKKKLILSILVIFCLFSQIGYSQGALVEREVKAIVECVLADIGLRSRPLIEELNARAMALKLEAIRVAPEIEKTWKTKSSEAFERYMAESAEQGTMISADVVELAQRKLHSPETLQQFMEAHPRILEGLTQEVQSIIAIVRDVAKIEGKEALWTWNQGALSELGRLLITEGGTEAAVKKSMPLPEFLMEKAMGKAIAANAAVIPAQKKALLGPIFPDFLVPIETFTTKPHDFLALLIAHGRFAFRGAQKAEQGSVYRFSSDAVQGGINLQFVSTSYNSGINSMMKVEISHSVGKVSVQHTFLYMDDTLIKWILTEDGIITSERLF